MQCTEMVDQIASFDLGGMKVRLKHRPDRASSSLDRPLLAPIATKGFDECD